MLNENNLDTEQEIAIFGNSSWQDDIDTSRSTGCNLVTYQGGVINHSSNLLKPISMSSAEAEYVKMCLAAMTGMHMMMLLGDLDLESYATQKVLPYLIAYLIRH